MNSYLIVDLYQRKQLESNPNLEDADFFEYSEAVLHVEHFPADKLNELAAESGVCGLSWFDSPDHPGCVIARACFEILVVERDRQFDAFRPTRRDDIQFLLGSRTLQHKAMRSSQNLPCQSDPTAVLSIFAPIALQLQGPILRPGETRSMFIIVFLPSKHFSYQHRVQS